MATRSALAATILLGLAVGPTSPALARDAVGCGVDISDDANAEWDRSFSWSFNPIATTAVNAPLIGRVDLHLGATCGAIVIGPEDVQGQRATYGRIVYQSGADQSTSGAFEEISHGPDSRKIDIPDPATVDEVVSQAQGRMRSEITFNPGQSPSYDVQRLGFRTIARVSWNLNDACMGPQTGEAGVRFVDPIVFGTGTFVSNVDGMTYTALELPVDGLGDRFFEEDFALGAPMAPPPGTNTVARHRAFAGVGANHDPSMMSGYQVYELVVARGPGGDTASFTPGASNGQFNFSFDKTAQQIEQDVLTHLAGNSRTVLFTSRVTVLEDPSSLPMITISAVDEGQDVLTVPAPSSGSGAGGAVPDGGQVPGTPLQLIKFADGTATLTWGDSCRSDDQDYAVYEGTLGLFTSHTPLMCSTGGQTSAGINLPVGSSYYLVAPNDTLVEGSLGVNGSGIERPPSAAACLPQMIALPVCP